MVATAAGGTGDLIDVVSEFEVLLSPEYAIYTIMLFSFPGYRDNLRSSSMKVVEPQKEKNKFY